MRALLLTLLLVPTLAIAQQPATPSPAGSNWQRVQILPVGDAVYVKTAAHKLRCAYQSSDADTFTCLKHDKPFVFQRTEILSIKLGHRGRSAAFGVIPGGILMIGGFVGGATANCTGQFLCGLGDALAVAAGGVLAGVGAGVGAASDFARSTIYVAP